ncbi:MAG TPA: NYN domain-containing protein, partial [Trueperaceae bacterium]
MGIAADIVRSWDYLDVVVLASGDGDFTPMLALAQERGCRVEVIAFKEAASQDLQDLADSFTNISELADIFV